MQNKFLPEETPEYQTSTPTVPKPGFALSPDDAAKNTPAPAARRALLGELERQYNRRNIIATLCFMAGLVCLLAYMTVISHLFPGCINAAPSLVFVPFLLTFALPMWLSSRRKPLLTEERIRQIDSAESVGPLLIMIWQALHQRDGEELYTALTRCLPRMKADIGFGLTERQHQQLIYRIRLNVRGFGLPLKRPDFCIAALMALKEVGDTQDVRFVEKIARMQARTPDAQRVRDAAQDYVPLMKARLKALADSQALLRASEPEKEKGDALLRAASGPDDANPNELLRPSDGGA